MKKVYQLLLALLSLCIYQLAIGQITAFPGAEGFARFATGGRGGEVYHVTNLNDTGAGSFRDAVSKSNRIVVFDVGGIINIGDRIVIQKNIYVAGQTAPGGGITIYGNGVALNSSSGNLILRYVRIRMGDQGDSRKDALGISDGQNYMFDNVSISWGWDGTVDANGDNIDNVTFQDCIISQGIDVVGHSTGGLMQCGKWSVIRSLYIDNETRNPKGKGTHEFINNVVYSWGSNGYIMGATDGLSEVNCVGNHFIYGPNSSSDSHITRTTASFHVYAADNWIDANKDGILNGYAMTDYKTATRVSTPYPYDGLNNVMTASKALQYVIKNAGGSFPKRDAVDEYLIDELLSYGKKGGVIVRESDNGIPNNVGTVANGTPPTDTDRDGMPDVWEINRGLNPNKADNNGDDDGDGYTNIEEYLSCLVGEGDPCSFNPLVDCNGVENGTATIDQCGICTGGTTGITACSGKIDAESFCTADGQSEAINSGFTGDGYLNFASVAECQAMWTIVSNGQQTVDIDVRYANGSTAGARAVNFAVGGAVQSSITGAYTGGWNVWKTETISLTFEDGANILTAQSTVTDGPNLDMFSFNSSEIQAGSCAEDCAGVYGGTASLDHCDRCVGGTTGLTACKPLVAEAEDISCTFDGAIENNASGIGFSGTGFLNGTNVLGGKVSFNIYSETASSIVFGVQYAHGGTQDRRCQILVNGVEDVASFSMPATAWTEYVSVQTDLNLQAGVNEITLVALTGDGIANFDYYFIYGNALFAGCETTQTIELVEGWNLISTNVFLTDNSISAVFKGLDVQTVKTMNGFWSKGQADYFNTLQSIVSGEGYLVNMNVAGELNLEGFKNLGGLATPQTGWNLIGCPYPTSTSFADVLGSKFSVVKDFEGFLIPNNTQSNIDSLEPGKAYFIKK